MCLTLLDTAKLDLALRHRRSWLSCTTSLVRWQANRRGFCGRMANAKRINSALQRTERAQVWLALQLDLCVCTAPRLSN